MYLIKLTVFIRLMNQVTMEENMILGALETLNEEVQEDGNHLRELGSVATSLSPILSDEESASTPLGSANSDQCATSLYPQGTSGNGRVNQQPSRDETFNAELDIVYIQKGANSRYR